MVKNLQDYLKTGRDPAYLKNGDTITEELARELICAGDEDGCLDGEFEITQSRSSEARASMRQSGEKVRTIRGHTSDCARQEWIKTSRRSTPR